MPDEALNVRSIFDRALEITLEEERTAYLDEACAGAPEVRRQVDALLDAYFSAGSFLESPPPGITAAEDASPLSKRSGSVIGPYKLLEQIGEGGMGLVFMAEQQEPVRRKVAVKLIKPGMDTRQVIARFEAERQALAVMDHPGIARVLDAGSTPSGHPYFVMELVRGIPIATYCDENNLPVRERLELFAAVCQAIQHAHTKGIIHRDIKPSNVLITQQDGRPVVKIIDFGIAKAMGQQLTEKTLFTNFAQMIGTPLYMSPEQAEHSGVDIDTRSDIYSLGVLLYELLTGSTPVDAEQLKQAAFDEIRRIIREDEPMVPSARISGSQTLPVIAAHRHVEPARLSKLVRGELDWIVMKSLEKDRNRRYETANAFAADLLHHLHDEPVLACPPSVAYRFGKFARRNRLALTTATLVAAALVLGTIASTWQAIRAETARQAEAEQRTVAEAASSAESEQRRVAEALRIEAEKQRDLTLKNLYISNVKLAHQDWNVGHLSRMTMALDALRPLQKARDSRGWEWYYLANLPSKHKDVIQPDLGRIIDVRWHPAGRLVAIAGVLGVKVYEPGSQRVVHSIAGRARVAWSVDGSRLATAFIGQPEGAIKVWTTENWQELFVVPGSAGPIRAIAWKADGKALAWAGGSKSNRFSIWEEGQAEPTTLSVTTSRGENPGLRSIEWSPDGRVLAIGGAFPQSLVLWDPVEQKLAKEFRELRGSVSQVAWSADGSRLASMTIDGYLGLWNTESEELVYQFGAQNGTGSSCCWSGDGKCLATGGEDNLVRIWSAENGRQLNRLPGHRAFVSSVDWSSEDRIVSGSIDGTVRFWRPQESQDAALVPGRNAVAWSPDGSRIVTNDPRHEGGESCSILESRTGEVSKSLQSIGGGSMNGFAWSPNGRMIAGNSMHDSAHIWDAVTGQLLHTFTTQDGSQIRCIAWSPDNRQLAGCGLDSLVRIWDASSGKLLKTFDEKGKQLGSVCWSPNGRWFATADWSRGIKIRSADTWQVQWEIEQKDPLVGAGAQGDYSIAWSPDSERLAAVKGAGQLVMWSLQDAAPAQKLWSVEAHTSNIRTLAWCPDGSRIASGSEDRTAKIWDAETGSELLTLDGHIQMVWSARWSPEGRRLATADNVSLRIWDASEAYETCKCEGE